MASTSAADLCELSKKKLVTETPTESRELSEKKLVTESREKWLINIMGEHRGDEDTTTLQPQFRPRIQKVPSMLRNVKAYQECFSPVFASIGPYHHYNPEFQTENVKKLKIDYAKQFVKTCQQDIEVVLNEVAEVVTQSRACYADGFTTEFDDEAFTRMMFLDGCFVLQFIYSYATDSSSAMCSYSTALLLRDLFLLENQLPFAILQTLMRSRFHGYDGENMIDKFINNQICPPGTMNPEDVPSVKDQQPLHLLDLLRTKLLGIHSTITSSFDDWHSFCSANELEATPIKIKKSNTFGLNKIEFKSYKTGGELSVPPLVIDDWTKPRFLNLIAFEMCPDALYNHGVISYICIMDALIDNVDDVKELRSKGIIINMLGSNKEVAHLFKQLRSHIMPDKRAYYQDKGGIETRYENKKKVPLLGFLTPHCSSPWAGVFTFFILASVTGLAYSFTTFCIDG